MERRSRCKADGAALRSVAIMDKRPETITVAAGQISGFGTESYQLALLAAKGLAK